MLQCTLSPLGVTKIQRACAFKCLFAAEWNEVRGKKSKTGDRILARLLIYRNAAVLLHDAKGTLGREATPQHAAAAAAAALEENIHITPG